MTTSPVEEAAALRAQLLGWAEAYFERDAPLVPDADYDQAMKRLEALERNSRIWRHLIHRRNASAQRH
ncbi:MAG: hypothetical protein CM15mP125_2140 [Gammaproteobacteria bacterium]|nr:MAG: hypothetical protein CM15mP125_2140 [Gammaproteobacteria bacterium]